jgi:hypothetical protein
VFHVTDTDTDSAVGSLVVSRVAADANANANARRRSAPLRAAAAWSSRRFIAGNKQARTHCQGHYFIVLGEESRSIVEDPSS